MARGGKSGRSGRNGASGAGAPADPEEKCTAPTSGLEDVLFSHGMARDAAVYEETKREITRYLGTQAWKDVSALTKALEWMEAPESAKPEEPKRMFWAEETKSAQTPNQMDGNKARDPVEADAIYAVRL